MPKVIQFTNQMFDYGVDRFFPEKVTKVGASVIDSRFLTTHGRFCIVADDGDFVTHVGSELGDSASYYAENKLGWDFTYYDHPAKKAEANDDEEESANDGDDGGSSEEEAGEGSDRGDSEAAGEADGEGSADGAGDGGEETPETPEGGDEAAVEDEIVEETEDTVVVKRTVTPHAPTENVEMDTHVGEPEEKSEPEPEPEPEPEEKPKASKKKGGRKKKKKS